MAQYDLTNKIGKYMDRHMIFPLLEFLSHHEVYINYFKKKKNKMINKKRKKKKKYQIIYKLF